MKFPSIFIILYEPEALFDIYPPIFCGGPVLFCTSLTPNYFSIFKWFRFFSFIPLMSD